MAARYLASCLAFALCASLCAGADDAEVKKVAKAKATECQNALLKGEYEAFADLTHPKVLEGSGGRKKMIELIKTETKAMKAKGIEFKSVKMGDASDLMPAGKELYISVPFTLEITVPDGRLVTKSTLVGISSDSGKTWVFIDTTPGREVLKKLFPDLPEKLPIAKKEPPTYIKE